MSYFEEFLKPKFTGTFDDNNKLNELIDEYCLKYLTVLALQLQT